MTRSELIRRLAKGFPQLTFTDAEMSIKVVLDAISDHLAQGDRVEIRGFGVFALNIRPAKIDRNPKTGEKVQVQVQEKLAAHFKPGKELRERVNFD